MATGVKRARELNVIDSETNRITVNGAKENTPERVNQALADIGASAPNFVNENLEAKTTGGFGYTVAPTTLDPLQFVTVENIVVSNFEFGVKSDQVTSTGRSVTGFITIDLISEIKTSNLDQAYYQVSLNGVNWIDPDGVNSTLSDLNSWISTTITTEVFFIRAYATFTGTGEAIINFKYS